MATNGNDVQYYTVSALNLCRSVTSMSFMVIKNRTTQLWLPNNLVPSKYQFFLVEGR